MEEKQPKKNNERKTPNLLWIYILLGGFLLVQLVMTSQAGPAKTTWKEVKENMLANKQVEKIVAVNGKRAEVYIKEEFLGGGGHDKLKPGQTGPHYVFNIGSNEILDSDLKNAEEEYDYKDSIERDFIERKNWLGDILAWTIPIIILIALWVYIMRRMSPGGGAGGANPFDFGKSKATLFDADQRSKVTFEDVAGLEEAKVEIIEIVDFLKTPNFYTRLGAKIPKGVMLVGPPGTGKTLLAKAVAGEAKVPFFSISGSEFVEMFVGVGASRVRDLFRKAKDKAPSIIFIDEIDAVGRARGSAFSMRANDERESTLNQLLTEMDGFETNSGVIVMAATNRADILDNALLRPGRFDRHIYLELPTLVERRAIFKVHLKPLTLAEDVDVDMLGSQTPGFSGADIANICNEAALIAARRKKEAVEMIDFMDASDRIIAGLEKKSKIISKAERRIIAYHEAGHATASWFLKHADALMKVTIVPRGKSLGAAWYLPEEHVIYTKAQFMDRICAALGGRAAEEIAFSEISSGALDDLEKTTKLAYTIVAYYGLNEKLGHISYYDSTGEYQQSFQRPYSEATARLIDNEVQELVRHAFERTKKIILDHKDKFVTLAELLLQKEVLVKKDLEDIFGSRPFGDDEGRLLKKSD